MGNASNKLDSIWVNLLSPAKAALLGVACLALAPFTLHAQVDFARDIQPILTEHCYKCHGPEKQKGGLRLDNKADAFKPGDSGEKAIVPGHGSQSRLLQLVSSPNETERMPPKSPPLSPAHVDLLKRWIDAGGEWPESAGQPKSAGARELSVTEEDRLHWAYLPLKKVEPPQIQDSGWARTPIDRFILAALEAKQLTPASPADRRKLIRRVYFDLVGLPPTPEEIEAFVSDPDPKAHEKLVDRLLASPHYGERWGRHWLDVARYADSNGQEGDQDRPTAYHYRDFVIKALNQDMPYDQFVRWQIAGDEYDPDNPLAVSATGFLVAGPHTVLNVPMEEEKLRNRYNELDDIISTTGSALLGLTLGCARCHDHKYDAVPTRDYYSLMAVFHSGDRREVPLATRAEIARHQASESAWKEKFEPAQKRFNDWLAEQKKPFSTRLRDEKIDALPVGEEEKALLKDAAQKNSGKVRDLQNKFRKELQIGDDDFRKVFTAGQLADWDRQAAELKKLDAAKPKELPTAYAMADFGPTPAETWLFDRGDFYEKKEPVQMGFLRVLSAGKSPQDYWTAARLERPLEKSTYQRKALAEWITDLEHGPGALLARVMVNRVWQRHFGEGLVRTVSDFGVQGEEPSHPELLEWLAHELVAGGWKFKPIHRLLMTSAVYLQDTTYAAAKAKIDPENRLLWHRRPQRIESEILRDAMLSVSGALNPEMFGPAFKPPIQAEAMQARNLRSPYPADAKDEPATRRRTIYMFHKRVIQYPLMQAFDGPDATASCGRRINTTVAPQALALLNDRFVRSRAEDFARRLQAEKGDAIHAIARRGHQLALGRIPTEIELSASIAFIQDQAANRAKRENVSEADARFHALADYCQALIGLNEFIYVD